MSSQSKKTWLRLDNAAKIFPPTSSKSDTRTFRFACELVEVINAETLQAALNITINNFPSFRYVIKRGLFWYYLEQTDIMPVVRKDDSPPCSKIYLNQTGLLFDVTYYGKRINLEVYHVLTDGTGAMQFLKTLALNYLKLAHPPALKNASSTDYDASETQKLSDSFKKYYDKTKKAVKDKPKSAYQLKGAKEAEWRLNVIQGSVSVKKLLEKAHEYDASATVFISSVLLFAIHAEMSARDRKKPVVISIPVNLRNFFDSKSLRNFFSLVYMEYKFTANTANLADVVKAAKQNFGEKLNEEFLQTRLNILFDLERNPFIRVVPLTLKNFFMGIAFAYARRETTAIVSNLGKVTMPKETEEYINLFDVFSGTDKMQVCICSYNDVMNISFATPFVSTDIQREFFRQLVKMGIDVKLAATNLRGDDE